MSDSLDPGDAFLSALGGAFLGFAAVIGVSLGGHFMGLVLHETAPAIAALSIRGFPSPGDIDISEVLFSWFGVIVGSFATWRGWPFIIFDIWLLARLRSGAGFFPTLLTLALVQPLHSLLVLDRFSSRTALELAIAFGLWIVLAIVTAALVLWWRRMSDEAPLSEPEETEPEL